MAHNRVLRRDHPRRPFAVRPPPEVYGDIHQPRILRADCVEARALLVASGDLEDQHHKTNSCRVVRLYQEVATTVTFGLGERQGWSAVASVRGEIGIFQIGTFIT